MTNVDPGPEETGWQQRLDREAERPQQNFRGLFLKQGNLLQESGDGNAFAITILEAGGLPCAALGPWILRPHPRSPINAVLGKRPVRNKLLI